jgi:hypothetical protein
MKYVIFTVEHDCQSSKELTVIKTAITDSSHYQAIG